MAATVELTQSGGGSAKVVALRVERVEPDRLLCSPLEVGFGLQCELQHPIRVSGAELVRLSTCLQSFGRELLQRLEHEESTLPSLAQQALVDQRCEAVEVGIDDGLEIGREHAWTPVTSGYP